MVIQQHSHNFSRQPGYNPSRTAPTHSKPRTKSANVVVQQHSRRLLKMGILMPETCWVFKKKNKHSKWHLVGFLYFSYHKMHGPINISYLELHSTWHNIPEDLGVNGLKIRVGRNMCARHEMTLESGSTAPLILKFGTSFRRRLVYPWEKSPRYLLNKRLGGP